MIFFVEVLLRLLRRSQSDDRVSVFEYFLAWQVVAIALMLALAGWSAFSAPW